MTGSTSNTPTQSEAYPVPVPVSTETAIPYCPAGFVPAGLRTDDMKSPSGTQQTQSSGWRTLIVVRWLQQKLSQVISRLHLLVITHGRSIRWRRLCRQFIQAGVALLLMVGLSPLPSAALASTPQAPATPESTSIVFVQRTGSLNPFNGVDVGIESTPTFIDLDADGDLDAIIGENAGYINYFKNTGSTTSPAFTQITGTLNPFNAVKFTFASFPSFADLDADGDLDGYFGEYDGFVNYFQNTGSATSPAFIQRVGTLNPFNGLDFDMRATPSFADLNGDGNLDAFIGDNDGIINYFDNTGSATSLAFVQQTGSLNPFNSVDVGFNSAPSFTDLDADSDLDAFIGNSDGLIFFFQNTGSATSPAFIARTGSLNPFNGVDTVWASIPSFADLDADGDGDAFLGNVDGTILYFENIEDSAANRTFKESSGSLNPFNGIDIGLVSAPSFADLDRDGDLDAYLGEKYGSIRHFQNTGSATAPAFTEHSGSLNPFDGVDVSMYSLPSFADLDGDGDLDAFIGQWDGIIRYYQNTGNAVSPAFDSIFGSLNPLDMVSLDYWSAPSFADLDGDGDLDAFIGDYFGTIQTFQNTGNATSPAFVQLSGSLNPLEGVDAGRFCNPSFIDLEGDGDLDLFTGNLDGMILFVENTGSATSPAFVSRSGSLNPFNGVDVGIYSTPSFADLDADGKIDAFIGESDGIINYFQNILESWRLYIPAVRR